MQETGAMCQRGGGGSWLVFYTLKNAESGVLKIWVEKNKWRQQLRSPARPPHTFPHSFFCSFPKALPACVITGVKEERRKELWLTLTRMFLYESAEFGCKRGHTRAVGIVSAETGSLGHLQCVSPPPHPLRPLWILCDARWYIRASLQRFVNHFSCTTPLAPKPVGHYN